RTRSNLEGQGYALGDDGVFRARGQDDYMPLYEAKQFHQFDHRYATLDGATSEEKGLETTESQHQSRSYVVLPRYWVPRADMEQVLAAIDWRYQWLLGYRRVAASTNERTGIFSILPRTGCGDSCFLMLPEFSMPHGILLLLANGNAITFDYILR